MKLKQINPTTQSNFSKNKDFHLGELRETLNQYEIGLTTLTGKKDPTFPPFRSTQEAIFYGMFATFPKMIPVWNLYACLSLKKERLATYEYKYLNHEGKQEMTFNASFLQFCREAIQAFRGRLFCPQSSLGKSVDQMFPNLEDTWELSPIEAHVDSRK